MSNIDLKLKANTVGYEIYCINCNKPETEIIDVEELNNIIHIGYKNVVANEYKCEECGCNTFDVSVFVKVDVEI
jgi:hypothetical protein